MTHQNYSKNSSELITPCLLAEHKIPSPPVLGLGGGQETKEDTVGTKIRANPETCFQELVSEKTTDFIAG